MRRILTLAVALVTMATFSINAQTKGPEASFSFEIHDFGKIKESDGPASVKFEFTNIGSMPLIISNVVASCGCTTPNWPKEPVVPGAKGTITVAYNPANRPGKFDKTITVTANTEPASTVLRIRGDVVPKQPGIEDMYPNDINGLRFKSTQIAINNIAPNAKNTQNAEVYNNTEEPMKVEFPRVPKHIQLKITPLTIQPKGKAIIEVTYDAAIKNDWGFVYDPIEFTINGKTNSNQRISVSANIQEDFTSLSTVQKENAPKIAFENATYDFGKIKQGEKVDFEYVFTNTGKSDLIIRKISPSCGCTVVDKNVQIIKPGEKGSIKSQFNSAGRTGSQSKTITVISNDPSNPRSILWIKGTIE